MIQNEKRKRIVAELTDKDFRSGFVEALIADRVPSQIREMRLARGWSQEDLGNRAGMRQSRIGLLERMDQPFVSIRTLVRLAEAFDVGLKVRFVPFSELADNFATPTTDHLNVPSFGEDLALQGPETLPELRDVGLFDMTVLTDPFAPTLSTTPTGWSSATATSIHGLTEEELPCLRVKEA